MSAAPGDQQAGPARGAVRRQGWEAADPLGAQAARQAQAPDALEGSPKPSRRLVLRERHELVDRDLQRPDLAEVDEPGQPADRTAHEGRAGARRADDEDRPLGGVPRLPGRLLPPTAGDACGCAAVEAQEVSGVGSRSHGAEAYSGVT